MLKFIGREGEGIPDIPARDLTDDEVRLYGGVIALVKTGLYAKVEEPIKKEPAKKDAAK